jgi:hypothetical protein
MQFRMLKIAFDMTCTVVTKLCCEKYGLVGVESSFVLCEWRYQNGVPVERRIAPNEIIANIVQTWQQGRLRSRLW